MNVKTKSASVVAKGGVIVSSQDCQMCKTADETSWWGQEGNTHCRVCHHTWKMKSVQAHCMTCHRHFVAPGWFDAHIGKDGEHRDPKHGNKILAQDETGTWRSYMTEEERIRLGFNSAPPGLSPEA